jgi:2-dehydro-3-deoxyglucarate aldolase/4-hydroxy-2-oxoheptanedioate aldolase
MQPNPLKAHLAKGGSAFGIMAFEFFTPVFPSVCKAAGADYILYDMEHSGASFETMKEQVMYCRAADIIPIVRVPGPDYHFIARALDIGMMGIMVPMVESAEVARHIVSCARYPTAGRRGSAFGITPHDNFSTMPVGEKQKLANERTLVICMAETPKGIENVDAIAAVDGVDMIWLGHFDLTTFMGIPAKFEDARFLSAVETIAAACRQHGKTAAYVAGNEAAARDFYGKGFRCIAYSNDVMLLQEALARGIAAMRKF